MLNAVDHHRLLHASDIHDALHAEQVSAAKAHDGFQTLVERSRIDRGFEHEIARIHASMTAGVVFMIMFMFMFMRVALPMAVLVRVAGSIDGRRFGAPSIVLGGTIRQRPVRPAKEPIRIRSALEDAFHGHPGCPGFERCHEICGRPAREQISFCQRDSVGDCDLFARLLVALQ